MAELPEEIDSARLLRQGDELLKSSRDLLRALDDVVPAPEEPAGGEGD